MSAPVVLPNIEMDVDEQGWELSEQRFFRAIHFIQDGIAATLLQAVEDIIQIAKTLAQTPYPPSSLPGEAPHQRTGRLWDSIDIFSITKQYIIFGADAPYAGFLEFGTSKMAPRPFFSPAIAELLDRYPSLLAIGLQEAVG